MAIINIENISSIDVNIGNGAGTGTSDDEGQNLQVDMTWFLPPGKRAQDLLEGLQKRFAVKGTIDNNRLPGQTYKIVGLVLPGGDGITKTKLQLV